MKNLFKLLHPFKSEEDINQVLRYRGHRKYEIKATGDVAKNYDFISARPPGKKTKYL